MRSLLLAGLCLLAVGAGPPPRLDRNGDPLPPGALARLGTTRFRHPSFRGAGLAFTPDGRSLVAGGENAFLRVFDARTGRVVRTIPFGRFYASGWASAFALSPDGSLAAVSGHGVEKEDAPSVYQIRLYEVATGNLRRVLKRSFNSGEASVAFSLDGKHLASVGRDGVARIEEVATGVELIQEPFRVSYGKVTFSKGGLLAVNGSYSSVFLWDWAAGTPPREIKVGPYGAEAVSFSGDGKTLAASDDIDGGVRLYDVASGKPVRTLADVDHGRCRVAFSPDGLLLATTSYRLRAAILWDAATGKEKRRIPLGGRDSGSLMWSPDSRRLAVGSDGDVRIWDVTTGKPSPAVPDGHRAAPGTVALLADGTAMTAADDGTIRLWEAATGKPLRTVAASPDHWVRGAAISPDGRWLVSSTLGEGHAVSLWDAATGRLVYRLPGHGAMGGRRAVAFSADGKRFLSYGDDDYLRVWDVRNGKATVDVAIRPDGEPRPDPDDPRGEMRSSRVGAVAFAPSALILARYDGHFVFDAATGKQVRKIAHTGRASSAAVSPDGKLLLVSGSGPQKETKLPGGMTRYNAGDPVVTLYDLATGKIVREQKHSLRYAGPVAFSGDGRRFAACSHDQENRLTFHDTASGVALGGFDLPERPWALTFSPDGRRLLVGLNDTTALLYPAPAKETPR